MATNPGPCAEKLNSPPLSARVASLTSTAPAGAAAASRQAVRGVWPMASGVPPTGATTAGPVSTPAHSSTGTPGRAVRSASAKARPVRIARRGPSSSARG